MAATDITADESLDLSVQQPRLERMVQLVLDEARSQGASSAEAAVSTSSGYNVDVRLGEVETIEHNRDNSVGVTVYFGQRKGSASTSDFSEAALREAVQAASAIARYTSEDACAGLADADQLAKNIPDLDLSHPWSVGPEQAIEIAQEAEAAAREADSRIVNSEGAGVASHQGLRVYGNSHGFLGGYTATRHSISCVVIGEQDGQMQRDYWYSGSRVPDELEDPAAIGRKAAERTVSHLGAGKLETRTAPVMFAAEIASGLLGHLISAIGGASQYRKNSFLLDMAGEKIFPDFVHVYERPHLLRASGSKPFDSEGVATRDRDLISDGVLQGYVMGSYSARKLGLQTTGNAGGVHNLRIDSGDLDQQQLLKQMDTGLLVTELMGQGVNTTTGDYSRGAAGFWVEKGEIVRPVEEITIAGNLRDMYQGLVAVGNDIDRRGNTWTGSWLIDAMTIAGN